MEAGDAVELTFEVIDEGRIRRMISDNGAGAISLFIGTTRDSFQGKKVIKLEYEAYEGMALKEMAGLIGEMRQKYSIIKMAIIHRLGEVPVGEASVVIGVSSCHRRDSLDAIDNAISTLKARVPIWKKELYDDGSSNWKENCECHLSHARHIHDHDEHKKYISEKTIFARIEWRSPGRHISTVLCVMSAYSLLDFRILHPLYFSGMPEDMVWVRCETCEHIFTAGYFDSDAMLKIFEFDHYQDEPISFPNNAGGLLDAQVEQQRLASARIVNAISFLRSKVPNRADYSGKWLGSMPSILYFALLMQYIEDVGCGSGALVGTAAEFGYTAFGIDARSDVVESLTKIGYVAVCGDFNTADLGEEVDVLSMADVLEHMPKPRSSLIKARSLLAQGGLLFLSMPNMDSFTWRTLDQRGTNPYWGELEHFHNFSRKSLHKLLHETGFQPIHYFVSERYIGCMEVVAEKIASVASSTTTS